LSTRGSHDLYESIRQWRRRKATSTEQILVNYEEAKTHSLAFLSHRKTQAIPKLAEIIKDLRQPEHIRHHAAEALGYVVNRPLHREPNPAHAAMHWLQRHGH
jgi:predicted ATPase with chaperone activity